MRYFLLPVSAQGYQQDDEEVLTERQALEKMGYEVVQVEPKGGATTFAEAMQELAKKTGHQPSFKRVRPLG